MKLRASFKTKAALIVAVITVCLGAAGAYIALRVTEQAIIRVALKNVGIIAEQRKIVIEHVIADSITFTRHLGSQRMVIDYLQQAHPQEQDPSLIEYFHQLDANGWYQAIYLMDTTGKTLVSTDPTFVGQNYAFRTYFKHAAAGEPTVDAAIGVTSKKFGYYFAHPVKDTSGSIVGVLVAKLKEQLIADALKPEGLDTEGSAMLVDAYGVVIQASRQELLFKSLGALTPEVRQAFAETKRFGDIDIASLHYDQVAERITRPQPAQRSTLEDGLPGHDELISAVSITNTPFFIVIAQTRRSFTQAAGNAGMIVGMIVLIVAIMIAVMLAILTITIVRPIVPRNMSLYAKDAAAEAASVDEKTKQKIWIQAADFERFRLAMESVSEHIVITDTDGHIFYANKAAENMTGYSRKEMIGHHPSLWGKQMPRTFYADMWHTIKYQKKTFHGEVTNRRKNGELYTAEVHIAPLITEQGKLHGFVGIERDITAEKNADRAKTNFASIASHQLRAPLAAINWYVEILSAEHVGVLNDAQRKYLRRIHEAGARMINLVNSLLSVSRIDTGSLTFEPEQIKLPEIADSVIDELRQAADKKHIRIVKQYDPALGPISADPNMMRIAFQNLISNAFKYTPARGVVTISIKRDDDRVRIIVADTGYGIPLGQQAHIFTKFFRADNARKQEPDGNGLGLYITKAIIDHAQGTITFTSEESKGSEFRITLPLSNTNTPDKHR